MKSILVNICIILATFCIIASADSCDEPLTKLELVPTFVNLTLSGQPDNVPVDLDYRDGKIYYTSLFGQVYAFDNSASVTTPSVFLDLSSLNPYIGFDEGLLAFEFHPNYPTVPKIYVTYTPTATSLAIVAFTVSSGVVNMSSMDVLFNITRPAARVVGDITEGYLGGDLLFQEGSDDDYDLYITVGFCNAATVSSTSLLGKVLRVTPRTSTTGYTIPSSNPGSNSPIFASGFRNPRKIFDTPNKIFIGEVGDVYDEINVLKKNRNFGYPAVEGCSGSFLYDKPVYSYTSSELHAITLGPYYSKDGEFESLQKRQLFADLYSGTLYSLQTSGLGAPCGQIVPDVVTVNGAVWASSILVVGDDVFVANVLSPFAGLPLFWKLVSVTVY